MWLILSEPFDPTASWLARGLAARGGGAVLHLTSRDIGDGARADRGVGDDGVWFRVVTAQGAVIDSRTLRGVVNRACSSPSALAHSLSRRGLAEAHAFGAPLLRWLHRWPGPVLNRPNVDGLTGDFRPKFWWTDHAVRAGFTVSRDAFEAPPTNQPGHSRESIWVAVVGTDVFCLDDPGRVLALSLRARCRRLADGSGAAILGIEAKVTETGEWVFLGKSLRPDLSRGGDTVIHSVARALGMNSWLAQAAPGRLGHGEGERP